MRNLMKRVIIGVITLGILVSSSVYAEEAKPISVNVNGKAITFDQPPVIEEGRTLVPLRAIFESLGAEVSWDQSTKTIIGKKENKLIILRINNATAYVDDKEIKLDVPAKVVGGRTLVPVRFISESLGAKVEWNKDTRTVEIQQLNLLGM